MARDFIGILGSVRTRAFKAGASDVKSVRAVSVSDSTSRVTIITPTSGKRVRIISVSLAHRSTTAVLDEIYFGTGANIGTTPANAIFEAFLDIDTGANNAATTFPDGGGPIGDVDEVVSMVTSANITTNLTAIVHYREE